MKNLSNIYKLATFVPRLNPLHENNNKNELIYLNEVDRSLGIRKLIIVNLLRELMFRFKGFLLTSGSSAYFFMKYAAEYLITRLKYYPGPSLFLSCILWHYIMGRISSCKRKRFSEIGFNHSDYKRKLLKDIAHFTKNIELT